LQIFGTIGNEVLVWCGSNLWLFRWLSFSFLQDLVHTNRQNCHTAAVCRTTDTGHTANGGHVTKFQGGDTNGSGCVGLQAELMHARKKPQFYCPLLPC